MTLAGGVLIVALILVLVLGFVVAWFVQDRARLKDLKWKAEMERDAWQKEVLRLDTQAKTVALVEGKRNEQKNAVAAGGFDASVAVLSDLAGTPRTGKTTDPRSVARVP